METITIIIESICIAILWVYNSWIVKGYNQILKDSDELIEMTIKSEKENRYLKAWLLSQGYSLETIEHVLKTQENYERTKQNQHSR